MVTINVYFMPFGESDIAHYISSKDAWYRRHVHSVFYYKNFMPDDDYMAYRNTQNDPKKKDKQTQPLFNLDFNYKFVSPDHIEYKMLNKCIQNYVNFAQESMIFPIFRVECLDKKGVTSGKNRTVHYFCESLQIGQELTSAFTDENRKIKNSDNYKDRFKSEETPKQIDVILKYIEYTEATESQSASQENPKQPPIKKDQASSFYAGRKRIHHSGEETGEVRCLLSAEQPRR